MYRSSLIGGISITYAELLCLKLTVVVDYNYIILNKCVKERADNNLSETVMGPGQKIRVKIFWLGQVSHLWFGFEFGKFPLKCQIFQYFSLWIKKISSSQVKKYLGYLLRVKSKLGSGRVRAHL